MNSYSKIRIHGFSQIETDKIHLMKENTKAARSITWALGLAAKKVSGVFLIHFEHSKANLQVIL